MQNIRLVIAYDGTSYLGWQKTPMGPSIEETLEKVLEQICQHPIHLQAASRTDAGVHAQGQVVNFLTTKTFIDSHRLVISLNSLLPKDIVVLQAEHADANFHPTLDSKSKEYRYYICTGMAQLPSLRFYAWHYPYALAIDQMREAAQQLIGSHDFLAFCNFKKNAHYADTIRQVNQIEIMELERQRLCIRVEGNHFLYKMVRNLVGTLAYVGRGKIKLEQIHLILEGKDRTQAGVTAPAHGLFLYQVNY